VTKFFFSRVKLQKTLAIATMVLAFGAGSYSVAQTAWDSPSDADLGQPLLSENELENLVAPIALYPDPLLSQVLVASTYPLEVFEAQGWLQQNGYLHGRALLAAAQEQNWDPSVQALVAFPDVLAMLNRDLSWTTELGNAFLGQQIDVMEAIQNLRAEARRGGKLASTPQFAVNFETQGERNAIEILPADPQVVYVPNYDPYAVWGPPAEGDYPALSYAEGSGFGDLFGTVADLAGFLPGFAGLLGPRSWGWALGWLAQTLFVNNSFFSDFGFHNSDGGLRGTSVWAHNDHHRLGVPYGNGEFAGWRGRGEGWRDEGWSRFGGGARGISGAEWRRTSARDRGRSTEGFHNFERGNLQRNNFQRNDMTERGGNWQRFGRGERTASASQFGRTLSQEARADRWQMNRGGGRDYFANSGGNRDLFARSRSFGSGSSHNEFANSRALGRDSSRAVKAHRGQGESSRVSAARMSSGRGSSFRHESGSQHRGWFGHGSSSSGRHGFSSHASRPKAPKAPKAPHFAKSHGGGHSSGGHSGKRSHRG